MTIIIHEINQSQTLISFLFIGGPQNDLFQLMYKIDIMCVSLSWLTVSRQENLPILQWEFLARAGRMAAFCSGGMRPPTLGQNHEKFISQKFAVLQYGFLFCKHRGHFFSSF